MKKKQFYLSNILIATCMFSRVLVIDCYTQTPLPATAIEINQYTAYFGYSASDAGDVNGDGYGDVIAGAYLYNNVESDEGRVYIFHGSATGILDTPAITLESNQANAKFGNAVASAGDVNNDGYDDIIVGAYLYDNGQLNEGRAYVYLGSATGINPLSAITVESNQADANFGVSVSRAGDINGDGYDDVIVGSDLFDNGQGNEGCAFIYNGTSDGINTVASAILENNQALAEFGFSVSDAGDINNDGYGDIIIGSYKYEGAGQIDAGRAYVYKGSAGGIIATPTSLSGLGTHYSYFGYSVSGAGDVNNDGYDDVIVGETQGDHLAADGGQAFIFHGSPAGVNTTPVTSLYGNDDWSKFGYSVSAAGDVDNDGYDDIIVGCVFYGNDQESEGRASIFKGSSIGVSTTVFSTMESDQTDSYFAAVVSTAGDVNNDGFDDLIVSARSYENGQSNEGKIFVYHGSNCTTSTFHPDNDGDGYGSSTASVVTCTVPAGYLTDNADCNDENIGQNPLTTWYIDADADFYFSGTGSPVTQCVSPGVGYAFEGIMGTGDCDDSNYQKYPDAEEQPDYFDNDCDGFIDESLNFQFEGFLSITDRGIVYDVSNAGDINGDGFDDIIIGAPDFDIPYIGIAMVFNGSIDGIQLTPSFVRSDTQTDTEFGNVAGAGDVNNDGYDDIIIGAPWFDNPSYREGKIEIFYGSSTGLPAIPNLKIEGSMSDLGLGNSVSSAGDINNDGYDDIIVGASLYNSSKGRIYVYYGSAVGITNSPLIINGTLPGEHFGYDVCSAGDVNGDGFDDVVVGAPLTDNGQYDEGRVYIFHGSASGLIISPAKILESNQPLFKFGFSVAGGGDINNDGFDDVIVGAPYYSNTELYEGGVYVYLGSSTGINSEPVLILENNITWGNFGMSVSGIMDMDNDNFDDIIIGSPNFSGNFFEEGKIYVYHGNSFALDVDNIETIEINQEDVNFGVSVSGAGDINGDSLPDIVVGVGNYLVGEDMEGGAFVYTSIPCAPSPELCNSLDDNCNGLIDDDITETISISAGGPITFCQGGSVSLTATYSGASLQWKKNGTNIPGATTATYNVTTKGNYSCVTSSACDTVESTPIFVNVIKNPNASISAGGPTTFCAGGSVILTEVAVAGCTYQWYKGATPIAGATSLTYTATTSGNYKCRVTKAASGCFKNSNAIAVSVPCKDGEFLNDENGFSIYPNPNNGTFTIEATVTTQHFASTESTIEIYNNLGQLIFSKQVIANDGMINELISLKNWTAGIYLIKLGINNTQNVKNIIIE